MSTAPQRGGPARTAGKPLRVVIADDQASVREGLELLLGHQGQRLGAVRGGADHVDAGQSAKQQDQALADAGLVVGDDDAQGLVGGHRTVTSPAASGSSAVTTHSSSRGPASSVPFSSRSRSRMPVSP